MPSADLPGKYNEKRPLVQSKQAELRRTRLTGLGDAAMTSDPHDVSRIRRRSCIFCRFRPSSTRMTLKSRRADHKTTDMVLLYYWSRFQRQVS